MVDAEAAVGLAVGLTGCTEPAQLVGQIDRLADVVGAEAALATSSRGWMTDLVVEVGDPAIYRPELMSAVGAHWTEHPVLVSDLGRPRSEARCLSDGMTAGERGRGDLFDSFYRPLGMVNELSVQLAWAPSGSSCCLTLHRGGRDYGERERELLELVASHLRAAWARVETRRRAGSTEASATGIPAATELAGRLPITAREAEVLALLVAGHTNDGIAHELGISRHTVVRHVEHVYAKLGVHNRAAATRVACRTYAETA
jgi:DNA-binding CsgD family transcriptional regulator